MSTSFNDGVPMRDNFDFLDRKLHHQDSTILLIWLDGMRVVFLRLLEEQYDLGKSGGGHTGLKPESWNIFVAGIRSTK